VNSEGLETSALILLRGYQILFFFKQKIKLLKKVEKWYTKLRSRHQNAGQNPDLKLTNRSSENVAQFKYFGTTGTNQNFIQEKIKRRLNSSNACYRSIQNLLSSRPLPRDVKTRIYRTIILHVALYGCETWSLT
jgi:hypothetical protein